MRTIKFRAWDKIGKEMFTPVMLSFPHGENRIIVSGRGGSTDTKDDDCILMQFTGLLDKNGKEIYEGDLLQCKNMIDSIELGWATGGATDTSYGFIWSTTKNSVTTSDDIEGRYEVIGNVWENPELIK